MTADEATKLVMLLAQTWPAHSVSPKVWESALTPLEPGAARAAYEQLRDSCVKPPTVAEFRGAYDALRPHSSRRAHSLHCICAGTGWVTTSTVGHGTFARCPHGPATGYLDPPTNFDQQAGAAAFATFDALIATGATQEDRANACFAAAEAYANTARTTLL